MPYFKKINTLLIHIPKTGGSSIETYFYTKYNIKRTFDTLFSYLFLTLNNHSLQHSTYIEIYEKKNYFDIDFDNIKIISVVRNPYDRIISDLFHFKLININSTPNEIYNKIIFFLNLDPIICDNHKVEQYKYLIDLDQKICSDIIILKTETLTEDIKKLGFEDFDYYENTTYRNKINYMNLLNNDSIKLINEYYDKDFEYFGYNKIIC